MSRGSHREGIPVLFVLPSLGLGGSERVVLTLCRHLKRNQYPSVVCAFKGGPLEKEMEDSGIPVHVLHRRDGIDLSLIWKLVGLIRRYRIEVVNSHHFVSLFYSFWASRWTATAHLHTEHSRWEMERLPFFWNWWFRFFLKRIDGVSAVSTATYEHLREFYNLSSQHVFLILNGIDVNQFASADPIQRGSIGLMPDDIVLGSVGNLRSEKNQRLLIEALAVLKRSRLPIRVVLVGGGPCEEELQQLAINLGVERQVVFLGPRTDTASLYRTFDIYCLTSHYEGLPLSILEAMAAGVPVIGTNVLGIRDVITHHDNGLLVSHLDPQELAQAILTLMGDQTLGQALAARAGRIVREQYSLPVFIRRYEDLFDRLIGTRAEYPSRSVT